MELSFLNQPQLQMILVPLFKVLFVIGAIFYTLFAGVIVRQINLKKNTLMTPVSPIVMTVGLAHLILSLGLVFFYLVIL